MYLQQVHIGSIETRRGIGSLELELGVVTHGVVSGTQTLVHWKNSQCSDPLNHFSSSSVGTFGVEFSVFLRIFLHED